MNIFLGILSTHFSRPFPSLLTFIMYNKLKDKWEEVYWIFFHNDFATTSYIVDTVSTFYIMWLQNFKNGVNTALYYSFKKVIFK